MNDLFASENLLSQIFSELSRQRDGGAVFLIENGLARDDTDQLMYLVGQRAEMHQFAKRAWAEFPLSLCVAVTEIGYEYKGTGTDFWPMVESAIKVEIPVPQRGVISDIFHDTAKRYGIARPMVDAWSSAFPHIAWPVRNAMVPREIHAPLAHLVREFLGQSRTLTVSRSALRGLRDLARGFGSRRLESWLQDDDLAHAVISHLVSGRTVEIAMEAGFLERLGRDLRSESEVRRLERSLRARRLARHQGLGNLPKATYELLLDDAEARGLALRGPRLSPAELENVRTELDVPLSNLTVTVGARSTTLERFLDGDAVFIGRPVGELPRPHLSEIEIPAWLAPSINPAPGLLFRDEGDDGYQPQLRPTDRVIAGTAFYEMKCEDISPETWGDGLYHFVTGTRDGDAALARHGMHVEAETLIDFVGGLTLFHDGDTIGQVAGRSVQVRPKTPLSLVADRLDKTETIEIPLPEHRWTLLPMTDGIWTLSPVGPAQNPQMDLVFRETEPPEAVSLTLQPDGVGLSEIARGAAALHLSTPVTLHDVEIKITLASSDGQSRTIQICIPVTPTRLGFDLPEFADVRAAARLWTGGGMHARLHARAQGLDDRSWTLTSPEPDWKLDRKSWQWVGIGMEPLGSLLCDPANSCATFVSHDPSRATPSSGYCLMRPDGPGDGPLRSCILLEPEVGTVLSSLPQITAAPVSRLSHSGNGTCGLIDALEAYISWSLAVTGTIIGDGVRTAACAKLEDRFVAALCGDHWIKTEKAQRERGKGFHARLVAEAAKYGLVCDTTAFSPVTEVQKNRLFGLLEISFRHIFPAPDLIVIPEGQMWPDLDDAVLYAWEQLSAEVTANGGAELEFDAGNADGSWQKMVIRARDAARFPVLSALLLPAKRATSLERLPYESSHFDDLIAALVQCHSDVQSRSSRWITPADLRALLLLFLAPERVMDDPEWRDRLLRFGADRFTARAVRYTALRYRALQTFGSS